ncbi:hypothetical protein A3B05_01155 [Candidatus Giovannonibacteria bacterium RIFCSPLOWO2_01_FULL_43_160]|uniref:Uncharacterized protein n=2 Tax=Candidatus Giovannoniibacteriota TaxID=1752738 RepID=A0A0G1IXB8_9BACT|nr:MAG: hypothetical protein UV72_C0001G0162 [Candidatus Giovannonibacteria bacterium GW2011_GWB1_43_13]KKS99634.1 MAG: hypothetical protein UV75_C0002G0015 [Candidatus Giovannonibacteria bacterium GW2011_GWA1_43_15]KKT21476.1 MAG: hypothetical protein UW05_C0009G0010 [Candidatus Giovannonibacteria bacterium GW2011_GWC2_43_8]KKT63720.1 MAG: hypothetical protein UW55_C0001G0013 [Candidatus Giovannonibacteria bacterium GW2011_GWA2_44_26]OGF58083.1 MAG: hypothetical protein A2652_02360 [Candidatus
MIRNPKILLVYPPNQLMDIEVPRPDGSLGLLYLASALQRAGFETDVLDVSVGNADDELTETFYRAVRQPNGLIRIGMSQERLREFIAKGGYACVGINSNFTAQTRMALEVAAIAKSGSADIKVIVGGVNARNLAKCFLDSDHVDAVCLTEAEKIIVRTAEELARGRGFEKVSGVLYKTGEQHLKNAVMPGDAYANLDDLPIPAWDKLLFKHYDAITSSRSGADSPQKARYAPIMTSRGCPFECLYCHISMEKVDSAGSGGIGSLRLKSVERVLEEVERLRNLGVKKLFFEDDSLLAKKSRVKTIFESVLGMGLEIAAINGVNLIHFQHKHSGRLKIDVEYLELLKNAGFDEISFPVESGSQRILDKYATAKLNLDRLDVVELVRIASRLGIKCPINMMIGFPDETKNEIRQTIELGKRLVEAGAPYCAFFIPIPFPGSRLYEIALAQNHLDQNFDPDKMNWMNVMMKNTIIPPDKLIEIRESAWREVNTPEYVAARLKSRADRAS